MMSGLRLRNGYQRVNVSEEFVKRWGAELRGSGRERGRHSIFTGETLGFNSVVLNWRVEEVSVSHLAVEHHRKAAEHHGSK